MTKEENMLDTFSKSTKEQIWAVYNRAIEQLGEKQIIAPGQEKTEEEKEVVVKLDGRSLGTIITDLVNLKSKAIKQIDAISEELATEFQKMTKLSAAIDLEQKHLKELRQINEVANNLSALLQAQNEQRRQFKLEMKQQRQVFEEEVMTKKLYWNQQNSQLELEYNEKKEQFEKNRKREEECNYKIELTRGREIDDCNNRKVLLGQELDNFKDNLSKITAKIAAKKQEYEFLKNKIDQFPEVIKNAVTTAEEVLKQKISEQCNLETQFKQKEYEGVLKLNDLGLTIWTTKLENKNFN